jgi:hypothetical protein
MASAASRSQRRFVRLPRPASAGEKLLAAAARKINSGALLAASPVPLDRDWACQQDVADGEDCDHRAKELNERVAKDLHRSLAMVPSSHSNRRE